MARYTRQVFTDGKVMHEQSDDMVAWEAVLQPTPPRCPACEAAARELADLRARVADLQAQNIELHERRIADLRRRRPRVEGRAHSIRCAGYRGVDAPFNDAYCDCGAIYNQLADLRAQIEALANEMETAERGVRLQYWIISLRKIAEKGAGENGMDILDRAIDRIEEHSWTQDGPMTDEDDAAIDLLKECREAAERELYAEKEAK